MLYNRSTQTARAEQERTSAALRAATAILRGSDTSRGGSSLQKSVARLRKHFALGAPDVETPAGDATRTAAARDRSRTTPALDPEPVEDYPLGYGPLWVPPALRIQANQRAKMLADIKAIKDDSPPLYGTEDDIPDTIQDHARDVARRMAAAKRKPNSRPMPSNGHR